MANQKSFYSIDKFKAEVKTKGVAEQDRFEVYISPPKCLNNAAIYNQSQLAALFADQVAFPPLSLFVKQCRIYGPAEQRPISSDYGGEGLTISFILDRDMMIKQMFDYWMQSIVGMGNHLVAYQDEYACDIEIRQLDRKNNIVYTVKLKDAFPKAMAQLDASSSDANQHHRMKVTFAYHKWTVKQMGDFSMTPTTANRVTTV